MKSYCQIVPHDDVVVINLYGMEIPTIDKEYLDIYNKGRQNQPLNVHEQSTSDKMKSIIKQFKEYKRIVIAMPVHNFNIPAKLKDYIDNIFIARETFRYTENGSIGLMTDGRKIMLLQTSGQVYTDVNRYAQVEYGHYYLKSIFIDFMGFDSFHLARAQGTDRKDADVLAILQTAYGEIDKEIPAFL